MPRQRVSNAGTTKSHSDLPPIIDLEIMWPAEGASMNAPLSRPFILSYRDTDNNEEGWIELNRYMTLAGAQREADELIGVTLATDRWESIDN